MSPISTFRARARSAGDSSSTGRPFSQYRPAVMDSRSASTARNVDFPQPEGPETETYSPRPMSTVTSRRAHVSSSASPLNTLLTPCRRMRGRLPSPACFWVSRVSVRRRHHIRPSDLPMIGASPTGSAADESSDVRWARLVAREGRDRAWLPMGQSRKMNRFEPRARLAALMALGLAIAPAAAPRGQQTPMLSADERAILQHVSAHSRDDGAALLELAVN